MYASSSIAMQPISPSYLFSGSAHANGSPFELYVSPSLLCASTSAVTVQPQFLSIWTAGSSVSMTVAARDVYGNWKTKSDSDVSLVFVRSRILDNSRVSHPGVLQSIQFPMSFTVLQRAFSSGLHAVDASFVPIYASGRGMHATYYRYPIDPLNDLFRYSDALILFCRSFVPSPSSASGNAVVSSMTNPFGSALDSKVWRTHASPSQYSIRWSGVYVAHLIGQHTFSVSAGALSNVKLYMNNLLLFQTEGNAKSATVMLDRGVNAMYEVLIEFQVKQQI
jgi:hypothetical protein